MNKIDSKYKAIAEAITKDGGAGTFIKCNKVNAKRIILRAIAKGWWFAAFQVEDQWHICFSVGVDLERDLRTRLDGLEFELD